MILSSKRKNPAIVREFFENSSFGAGAHFFSGKKQEADKKVEMDQMYLQNLEEFINDESKMVTYILSKTSLSRLLALN